MELGNTDPSLSEDSIADREMVLSASSGQSPWTCQLSGLLQARSDFTCCFCTPTDTNLAEVQCLQTPAGLTKNQVLAGPCAALS
jgi:hypothetical protein